MWLTDEEAPPRPHAPYTPATPHSLTREEVFVVLAGEATVEISAAGDVEEIYEEIESEWAAVIGAPALERVRRDVRQAVLAAHGGELPAVRPAW